MKLRDRKKRVFDNIKQEDYKSNFTRTNIPSFTVTQSSTCSLNIKQEDSKNEINLLQQDGKLTGLLIVNII